MAPLQHSLISENKKIFLEKKQPSKQKIFSFKFNAYKGMILFHVLGQSNKALFSIHLQFTSNDIDWVSGHWE